MSTTRSTDIELWQKWHASRSNADLERLMAQMMPVMRNDINSWSRVMPQFVAEGEAKRLALGAFETFDPNRGVLLSTHLVNSLQKLKRIGYEHQSSVSIPEHQRITYNRIRKSEAELEDTFGRKPTMDELSDHLALPHHVIRGVLNNVERKEFLESGEGPAFAQTEDDDFIHLAYHDMTPLQKRIFEMRTGYNGTNTEDKSKIRSGAEIIKELGITQAQLSYQIKKIEEMLKEAEGLRL